MHGYVEKNPKGPQISIAPLSKALNETQYPKCKKQKARALNEEHAYAHGFYLSETTCFGIQ